MKFLRKYNQFRRDCDCDLECENCGNLETIKDAYDDRNYWDNVVPNFKCSKCEKSSNDLGIKPIEVATKYADYETI